MSAKKIEESKFTCIITSISVSVTRTIHLITGVYVSYKDVTILPAKLSSYQKKKK